MAVSLAVLGAISFSAVPPSARQDPEFKSVSIEVPQYQGDSYCANIPHTIDLAARASLCINAITSPVTPQYDFSHYTYVEMHHHPPYLAMEAGITNLNPKWLEVRPARTTVWEHYFRGLRPGVHGQEGA
jgi:hypothetical protein